MSVVTSQRDRRHVVSHDAQTGLRQLVFTNHMRSGESWSFAGQRKRKPCIKNSVIASLRICRHDLCYLLLFAHCNVQTFAWELFLTVMREFSQVLLSGWDNGQPIMENIPADPLRAWSRRIPSVHLLANFRTARVYRSTGLAVCSILDITESRRAGHRGSRSNPRSSSYPPPLRFSSARVCFN